MKKFWLGLLSTIILLGGSLLSACGGVDITITLSDTHKEICLNDDSDHNSTVIATVNGIDGGTVTASSSYENIATASAVYNSVTGQNVITINAISEGEAEIVVTSNYDSSVKSVISVTVYSNVLSLSQKQEDTLSKSNMFVLKGKSNKLDSDILLESNPVSARKNIAWSLPLDASRYISLVGNELSISDEYNEKDEKGYLPITLIATDLYTDISTEIILSVIEPLTSEGLSMEYSHNMSQSYAHLAGQVINIVPNIATDNDYTAYIKFTFASREGVSPEAVILSNGEIDDTGVSILSLSSSVDGGYTTYIYEVKSLKASLNKSFTAYFNVGYSKYNYQIKSSQFKIDCYEKVNALNVYNEEGSLANSSVQTIYTSYAFPYGTKYKIELLPVSVTHATGKYSILVDYTDCGESDATIVTDTLQFYFKTLNGGYSRINMLPNGDSGLQFISDENNLPSSSELYILAGDNFVKSSLTNVKLTFRSFDNSEVKNTCTVNLYKSASALVFGGDTNVSLSTASTTSVTKTYILEGQNSIEGLSVETTGEGFTASSPVLIESENGMVAFNITFSVKPDSIGLTNDCSYVIKHKNGMKSESFPVKLFLPMTDARVEYDNTNSSITNSGYSDKFAGLYVVSKNENGRETLILQNDSSLSVSNLLVQTGASVPFAFLTNRVQGKYASAKLSFEYLDMINTDYELEAFTALEADQIYSHGNKSQQSSILSMSDASLITRNTTGFSYLIITFTGLDNNGNETKFVRIILVENYVAPTEFIIQPSYAQVFAGDSVSSKDSEETTQNVTIMLSSVPMTYYSLDYFTFTSGIMGEGSKIGNMVIWEGSEGGYYNISNIVVTSTYISFDINGLTTKGSDIWTDNLTVSYYNTDKNEKNIRPNGVINVEVKNADRIEKLIWENDSEDGLYFEVGDREPSILVITSTPQYVKNPDLSFIVTDKAGNIGNFVQVSKLDNNGQVSLNAKEGKTGFIYILPSDAIYQSKIAYYDRTADVSETGKPINQIIESSKLGQIKENGKTWFDYLCENGYFINNKKEEIPFSNILIRIAVTVADGSSEEYAYNIYDEADLYSIESNKYYKVMNNLTLENWPGFNFVTLTGGIRGDNSDITITIKGKNFLNVNNGIIRDLTFAGQVNGGGFVANVNNGRIDNVTIDVFSGDGVYEMSTLDGSSYIAESVGDDNSAYIGGIVGTNSSIVTNVNVLGLQIVGANSGSYVGGIIGKQDGGSLSNARFEFYNFSTGVNTISGDYVGGVVGRFNGGTLTYVYAYDYTLSTTKILHLDGNFAGGIVGHVDGGEKIEKSFAVVGLANIFGDNSITDIKDVYISYFDNDIYTSDTIISNNNNWEFSSSSNFKSYVNDGKEYLKEFYQQEAISSVDGYNIAEKVVEGNNYYKALRVSENSGVMFRYAVNSRELALMSDSERRGLNDYNTTSLAALLNITEDEARRLVVASSDARVLEVSGNNIIVKQNGTATLTISSKQDYTKNKQISIYVINAISDLKASWAYTGGIEEIADNSDINLQRGKSLAVTYTFEHSSLHVGLQGNSFDLLTNDYELEHATEGIDYQTVGKNILNLNTSSDNAAHKYKISTCVNLTGKEDYIVKANETIRNSFVKNYNLALFDGAIYLGASASGVSITPATIGAVEVELTSGDKNDMLVPEVSMKIADNNIKLQLSKLDETSKNSNVWIASLGNEKRIKVEVVPFASNQTATAVNGRYTLKFNLYMSVYDDYRNQVSQDQTYTVTLTSKHQATSASFALNISRQEFTNISITNHSVDNMLYQKIGTGEDADKYVTKYQVGEMTTGVLSPGSSSILKVNVNPKFAYYDHFTMEYSGASIASAATVRFMTKDARMLNTYYEDYTSTIEPIANGISVVPNKQAKENNDLFFKIWASDTIMQDTVLKLTIKFYDNKSSIPITFANYFLTVSYLSEPQILVDGYSTSILAKGQTAQVKVVVPFDQDVDINTMVVENIEGGITLSTDGTWDESSAIGTKVYTTRISARVDAKVKDDANGIFRISVVVSRVINGHEERKTAFAIVNLVDFKVDLDNISLAGSNEDTFVTYLGMEQPLTFNVPLLPENYIYDTSDPESVEAMAKIKHAIETYKKQGHYQDTNASYFINHKRDENGNALLTEEDGVLDLSQRLYYFSKTNENWLNVRSGDEYSSVGGYLEWKVTKGLNNDEIINIKGLKPTNDSDPVRLKLQTTVQIGDFYFVSDYEFNVLVKTYSDEDTPLIISSEEQFIEMADRERADYILMNDIILRNYTPFDTNNIASLDGNGHTIYIDSYNLYPTNTKTLNLALFNNVASTTTLKNIRVNIYNGGQITADIQEYSSVNIAGFAINNEGIITNCEVVSFHKTGYTSSQNQKSGLVVKYIRGEGTSTPQYLTDGSNWTSQVAGFVLTNAGSITNSRVGGNSVYTVGSKLPSLDSVYIRDKETLQNFYIEGQGDVAGFVLANTGTIASSFVKNFGLDNQSDSSAYITAGFAGSNNGKILTSYIEGVKDDAASNNDKWCRQGSSLTSKLGIISGFVYQNGGQIQDSYSNILISNKSTEQTYLASGFVYENKGSIKNCFSASQIVSLQYSQMNFSGVDKNGNLLANGEYINCYYYRSSKLGNDAPTEESYNTGAIQLVEIDDEKYFYGFAFNSSDNRINGVWSLNKDEGSLTLVEPNKIAFSNRYYLEGKEEGVYSLPYSTMYDNGEINIDYGTENNPILIRNAQEFANVMGNSTSTYISKCFTPTEIRGTYRIVADIDFSALLAASEDKETIELPSTSRAFTGSLFGNGFTLSNLSIRSSTKVLSYGMFASIEGGAITNLNLGISKVANNLASFVGGLTGIVKNSNIVNIDVKNDENSEIEGLNFVGGLVGIVMGDSKIKNITVDSPNVIADRFVTNGQEGTEGDSARPSIVSTLTANMSTDFRMMIVHIDKVLITEANANVLNEITQFIDNMSYAGGAFGYIDIFTEKESTLKTYIYKESNLITISDYDVSRVRITTSARVQGQVVGGFAGFTGMQTDVKDVGIVLEDSTNESLSRIISTKFYAGGLIGQAYGNMTQLFAEHEKTIQNQIENNLRSYYQSPSDIERGSLSIFNTEGTDRDYVPKYIGGLIGYVGSGQLSISYSKLNVINTRADHVGGIIGIINSKTSQVYYVSDGNEGSKLNVITKYYIYEAYATGDVRAKQSAGGIVGRVENGSTVVFENVNSANFISVYNYDLGVNYRQEDFRKETENDVIYSFDAINVYAIVGSYHTSDVSGQEKPSDINYLKKYLVKVEGSAGQEQIKTVGQTQDYTTTLITNETSGIVTDKGRIKLSAHKGAIIPNFSEETKDRELTFAIPSLSNYASSVAGYDETYGSFLGNSWSANNWIHTSATLYPIIKYPVAQNSFIYLDAYDESIEKAIKAMNQSNVEIRVRGLISKNAPSNQRKDVDIADYIKRNPSISNGSEGLIQGYQGKLVGDREYFTMGTDEYPSIILDRPMFESTKSGFNVSNLTIKFKPTSKNNDIFSDSSLYTGTFINGTVEDGTIDNLTLDFTGITDNTVHLGNKNSTNVGLLAAKLNGTSIYGLEIFIKTNNGKVFFNANGKNIGLVAGEAIQNSAARRMNFSGINIYNSTENPSDLMIANDAVNVGTYFGNIAAVDAETEGAAKISLEIGTFGNTFKPGAEPKSRTLNGTYPVIKISGGTVNAGGYVGSASTVEEIKFADIATAINVKMEISGVSDINAGALFGTLNGAANKLSAKGELYNSRTFNSVIYHDDSTNVSSANIGGLIGQTTGGDTTIENIITNFDLFGRTKEDNNSGIQVTEDYVNSLKENYIFYPFNVGDANVGGLVGNSSGLLTINSNIAGNGVFEYNTAESKDDGTIQANVIAVNGTNVNVGGLVGLAGKLEIAGRFKTGAMISANGSTKANIGGLVGKTTGESVEITSGTGADNVSIAANAEIFTSSEASVGGMIGFVEGSETTVLNLQNTSFGGSIKVYGGNAQGKNLDIGGSLGSIEGQVQVTIQQNYNYGDVFMLYGEKFKSHGELFYGGLIGNGVNITDAAAGGDVGIQNNYILMTLNDQRPLVSDNYHAVFGNISADVTKQNNYYNHGVCLLTDEFATDAGYMHAYKDNHKIIGGGYTGGDNYGFYTGDDLPALATAFKNKLSSFVDENNSKLNPAQISSTSIDKDGSLKTEKNFHGITYYYLGTDFTLSSQITELDNIAIIGDGYTLKYENTNASPIEKITNYSFVSALNFSVDIKDENTSTTNSETVTNKTSFGGVAANMESGILYAVGVNGKIEVGGTEAINIGGLVGTITNGLISQSVSDVHILYRAGKGGSSAAVAVSDSTSTDVKPIIMFTYAVGTVECYIDSHIDGFSKGNADVRYCYTTANLEWHDYTSATTEETDKITVFNRANLTFCMNDKHATKIGENTTSCVRDFTSGSNWVRDDIYNYGYPTRKFNYLKYSSYAKREEDNATDAEKERGIHTYTYTRLSGPDVWGDKAESVRTAAYYMIPNAGVWHQVLPEETAIAKYIVLRNDLYLDYVDKNTTIKTLNARLNLDGQGHRIYGFNGTSLFDQLSYNSEVINLDILNAISTGEGIIASFSRGITFSNITLSGSLKSEASVTAGAVVGRADESHFYSIMSNVKIFCKSYGSIGGIVGSDTGSEFKYCVNNGPINATGSASGSANVGGIVGISQQGTTIEYSYNTASILAGYVATSATLNNYAGGIVGKSVSNISIDHCYNSGLVISGNKKCTNDQYAGGIIAHVGGEANVTNCINEGSVRAIAVNAKYNVKRLELKPIITSLWIELGVYQDTDRNVFANGIGFEIKDHPIANSTNYNNNIEIINDGAGLVKGSAVYKMNKNRIPMITEVDYFTRIISVPDYSEKDDDRIVITSRDNYNVPVSFYYKKDFSLTYKYHLGNSNGKTKGLHTYVADPYSIDTVSSYYGASVGESGASTYYNITEGGDPYQNRIRNQDAVKISIDDNLVDSIIGATSAKPDVDSQVFINGHAYYLTNGSGSDLAINMNSSNIYDKSDIITNLPYNTDKNCYSINVIDKNTYDDGSNTITAIITGITNVNNKAKLAIKIFSTYVIENWANVDFEVDYVTTESTKLHLSDFNYSYYEYDNDEARKGTIIIELNSVQENGLSLLAGINAHLESSEGADELMVYKTKIDGKELYLQYDQNVNTLTYIPNIFIDENGGIKEVNTDKLIPYDFADKDVTIYYFVSDHATFTTQINTGGDNSTQLSQKEHSSIVIDKTVSSSQTVSKANIKVGDTGSTTISAPNNFTSSFIVAKKSEINNVTQTYEEVSVTAEISNVSNGTAVSVFNGSTELARFNGTTWTEINSLIVDGELANFLNGVWTFKNISQSVYDSINSLGLMTKFGSYTQTLNIDNSTWKKGVVTIADNNVATYSNNTYGILLGNINFQGKDLIITQNENQLTVTVNSACTYSELSTLLSQLNVTFAYQIIEDNYIVDTIKPALTIEHSGSDGVLSYIGNYNYSKISNFDSAYLKLDSDRQSVKLDLDKLTSIKAGEITVYTSSYSTKYTYTAEYTAPESINVKIDTSASNYINEYAVITSDGVELQNGNANPYYIDSSNNVKIITYKLTGQTSRVDIDIYPYISQGFIISDDGVNKENIFSTVDNFEMNVTWIEDIKEIDDKKEGNMFSYSFRYKGNNISEIEIDVAKNSNGRRYHYSMLGEYRNNDLVSYNWFTSTNDPNDINKELKVNILSYKDGKFIVNGNESDTIPEGFTIKFKAYNSETQNFEDLSMDFVKSDFDIYFSVLNVVKTDTEYKIYYDLNRSPDLLRTEQYKNSMTDIFGQTTEKEESTSSLKFSVNYYGEDSLSNVKLPKLTDSIEQNKLGFEYENIDQENDIIVVKDSKLNVLYTYSKENGNIGTHLEKTYNYKPNNNEEIYIDYSLKRFDNFNISISSWTKRENYYGIIFTRNMNIGDIIPFDFEGQINGNKYTLSYNNRNSIAHYVKILFNIRDGNQKGLFSNIKEKSLKTNEITFIQNINIVGQISATETTALMSAYSSILTSENNGIIKNVTTYGNIRNVVYNSNSVTNGVVYHNKGVLNNITSYVTINSLSATSFNSLAPKINGIVGRNTGEIEGIVNLYGTIIAGNGYRGKTGESTVKVNSTYGYGLNGKNGEDGSEGGDISLLGTKQPEGLAFNYNGVFVVGQGGNGGAGGTGANGSITRFYYGTTKGNKNGGCGGNAGEAGAHGNIYVYSSVNATQTEQSSVSLNNSINGSPGSGGMHGWVIPRYGSNDVTFFDLRWFNHININSYLDINYQLKVGQSGNIPDDFRQERLTLSSSNPHVWKTGWILGRELHWDEGHLFTTWWNNYEDIEFVLISVLFPNVVIQDRESLLSAGVEIAEEDAYGIDEFTNTGLAKPSKEINFSTK